MTVGRATALALKELYRPVSVREGDEVVRLPAIQAILRSKVALAARGNGPAQRHLIEIARAIEKEIAATAEHVRARKPTSDLEAARRIAAALMKVASNDSG